MEYFDNIKRIEDALEHIINPLTIKELIRNSKDKKTGKIHRKKILFTEVSKNAIYLNKDYERRIYGLLKATLKNESILIEYNYVIEIVGEESLPLNVGDSN